MSVIYNERTKLLANALDRASTSCLTVGFIGPIVAVIYDLGGAGSKITALTLYIGSAFWLLAGIALHLIARAVLGRLK
jgi:multisubunit Na+/H+ antiporter MnhG subunit